MLKLAKKINNRQELILNFLEGNLKYEIGDILAYLKISFPEISKVTVNRDLLSLIKIGFIDREGRARSVKYFLSFDYNLIKPIKVEEYFKISTDERNVRQNFNFDIFEHFNFVFEDAEINYLKKINDEYQNNLRKISAEEAKKEFERLLIELSWKSSQIEGNTYTLLETENLIKEKKEAVGHKKEEAVMILNHKKAFEYILQNKDSYKSIDLQKIQEVHALLTDRLDIAKNFRKRPAGIVGTKYMPLSNEFQIKEVVEKTCELVNKKNNPFEKAILLMLLLAYIQPFEDGNKRTSRLLGNAILLSFDLCPLSYRSVNEMEYKKAVIIFYEQNNLNYFKKLFIEQFEFAVKNYFRS